MMQDSRRDDKDGERGFVGRGTGSGTGTGSGSGSVEFQLDSRLTETGPAPACLEGRTLKHKYFRL